MVNDLNNLVRLKKSQVEPAAEMLGRAFHNNPTSAYFFPDTAERERKLPYVFQSSINYGISHGEVYAPSLNLEAVTVWLPSEKANVSLGEVVRSGLGEEFAGRLAYIDKYTASAHGRNAPFRHWFLFVIGVDPVFQRKGYASTLLKAMFARIDNEQLPCYLEADDAKNIPFYQHFGFEVVEEIIVPGIEVKLWPMLRKGSD
jgi:ribosomal protein S18 acetylase RimI-like enzyme